ncbi:MAG: sensor histidine kinase [Caulobacteraceae bacterium]
MLFLDDATLDKLYPCRLRIAANGAIEHAGPTILRVFGSALLDRPFAEVFEVLQPKRAEANALGSLSADIPIVVSSRDAETISFRGAVLQIGHGGQHLLMAALPNGAGAVSKNLRFADFAPTDGAVDLLLAMEARDASVEDARRLAERLAETRGAEAANKAKSQFLAGMSHELRTPLNAIIGYTEMAIEDVSPLDMGQTVADLNRVLSTSKHLLSLINEVLDLAKIESGKMEINFTLVDFDEIVREAAATIAPIARNGGNRTVVAIEGNLRAGTTDAKKLRQCVLNLLGNASKFTSDGVITISACALVIGGVEAIEIAVADNGIGMSPDQIAKLFRPFAQASAEISRVFGGTGLGLAITKHLSGLLGGDIAVESAVGQGSRFVLRLPRNRPEDPSAAPADSEPCAA